jgi:hypothetical protein
VLKIRLGAIKDIPVVVRQAVPHIHPVVVVAQALQDVQPARDLAAVAREDKEDLLGLQGNKRGLQVVVVVVVMDHKVQQVMEDWAVGAQVVEVLLQNQDNGKRFCRDMPRQVQVLRILVVVVVVVVTLDLIHTDQGAMAALA